MAFEIQDDRIRFFRENSVRNVNFDGFVRPPYGSHDLDLPANDRGR
jgi:hypothetical protein